MDSSMSIENYFDYSKLWISSLLKSTSDLFKHETDKILQSTDKNENDLSLCLRTAFVIFDHEVKLIWNLDDFNGNYQHDVAISMLTEANNYHQYDRLSGTHTS